MKKKIFVALLLMIMLFPFATNAAEKKYSTKNLKQTLKEEEIDYKFKSYKETDDQVVIYMFRGKGCGYCRAFLEFLNSITDEYGKKFKLVSYEVWYDETNRELMQEVGTFLNNPAQGVPYIVIGDKVFAGYSSQYDDQIKAQINSLYKTKKSKRYDVMKEMKKDSTESDGSFNVSLLWMIVSIAVATIVGTCASIFVTTKKINNATDKILAEVKKTNKPAKAKK